VWAIHAQQPALIVDTSMMTEGAIPLTTGTVAADRTASAPAGAFGERWRGRVLITRRSKQVRS
jgi:hypothetical protein